MIFSKETSLISKGDFIDIYYKIKFKGLKFIFSKLSKYSYNDKVSSKWDTYASVSDFWIIPEIKKNWNYKITGDSLKIYEDYIYEKYLKNKANLNLISIGCGDGGHERNFAKYNIFSEIIGIDVSQESINKAQLTAKTLGLEINYLKDDFIQMDFLDKKFDVILFNASLHHFENIDSFLKNKIEPILKKDGILVVYEYCGPNRLQWRNSQLKVANAILKEIPNKFKTRIDGKTIKKKVYRPGLIRMLLNDPSEAPDSMNISSSLKNNFKTLEETKLGWNILHLLLKDIAHNFLSNDAETTNLIKKLIQKEDDFVNSTQENDAMFGVYQKN